MEKIRAGDGKGKTLLVIDGETEKEMSQRVSTFLGGLAADHQFHGNRVKSQMNLMHW